MSDGPVTLVPAAIDAALPIEELVDRDLLDELCQSLFALFGIPIRLFSAGGSTYGVVAHEHEFCTLVNTAKEGRAQCRATVDAVKANSPPSAVVHPCFTGLAYHIEPLEYEARVYGRVVIGPFAPAALREITPEGRTALAVLDGDKSATLLAKVPRAKPETVARVAAHLRTALDIILFNAHKTAVTSSTHLMSVRENFRELTEKNEKLQAAYNQLKEADRLKSSFLATVSHELKTPLTSILGYSEMLSEGIAGPLAEEQAEFVRTIHEKGTHLLAMITGLLDLSKLEIGTMRMRRENARIADILRDVCSTLLPHAKKKGVELVFDCKEEAFTVRVDPVRLQQVFTNIVENAVKFTEAGGSVRITDRIVEEDDGTDDEIGFAIMASKTSYVEVRVADTGLGIPEGERDRVFDAFYQVDSSSTREHGGTGLGLAIAKRVVLAHGGSIAIEGNTPRGTVFVVRIPSAEVARPSIPSVALFEETPALFDETASGSDRR